MQHRSGATPLSGRWDSGAFKRDARADDLDTLLRLIPKSSSVAAPDFALAHVAERALIQHVPWERPVEYVLLSVEHRARFEASQDLWRSAEETVVRNTLAMSQYGVFAVQGRPSACSAADGPSARMREAKVCRILHLTDGHSRPACRYWACACAGGVGDPPRSRWDLCHGGLLGRAAHMAGRRGDRSSAGVPLRTAGDRLDPAHIVPALPFDGLFSPAHVRVGEVARTEVFLPVENQELQSSPLFFGARRIDGSRLDPESAHWTELR